MFRTWVWQHDHDLDMVTGLWYTHVLNFCSILILEVQRTSMSFKSLFWALEDAGGSLLGFVILNLMFIWFLVFGTPRI